MSEEVIVIFTSSSGVLIETTEIETETFVTVQTLLDYLKEVGSLEQSTDSISVKQNGRVVRVDATLLELIDSSNEFIRQHTIWLTLQAKSAISSLSSDTKREKNSDANQEALSNSGSSLHQPAVKKIRREILHSQRHENSLQVENTRLQQTVTQQAQEIERLKKEVMRLEWQAQSSSQQVHRDSALMRVQIENDRLKRQNRQLSAQLEMYRQRIMEPALRLFDIK